MKRRIAVLSLAVVMVTSTTTVMSGCGATTPGEPDPLAGVCPGGDAELAAIRLLIGGFVSQGATKENAQSVMEDSCTQNADPGDDYNACVACANAVIDEAYDQ